MSTRFRVILVSTFLAALILPVLAFASPKTDILASTREWEAKLEAGDAAGIAALYAEDAQLLPPNMAIVNGRASIQQFWQGAIDAGMKHGKLELVELHGSGDTMTEVGRYVISDGNGKTLETGKYTVIWKKVKGRWSLYRDMWNSSDPVAAPAK
jgi:ketosteroid isomerase-like protein